MIKDLHSLIDFDTFKKKKSKSTLKNDDFLFTLLLLILSACGTSDRNILEVQSEFIKFILLLPALAGLSAQCVSARK